MEFILEALKSAHPYILNVGFRVHIFTLVILFLFKKENRKANLIFCMFLVSMGFHDISVTRVYFNQTGTAIGTIQIMNTYSFFLFGPLLYFYIRTLIVEDFTLGWKQWIQLLPFLFQLFYAIYLYVQFEEIDLNTKAEILMPLKNQFELYIIYSYPAGYIHVIIYLLFSWKLVNKYEEWVPQRFSNTYGITLQWIKNLITIFMFVFFLGILIVFVRFSLHMNVYVVFYVAFYFGSYVLALKGYRIDNAPKLNLHVLQNQENKPLLKVTQEEKEELNKVIKAIEEKEFYLNPTLKLSDLSKLTKIPQYKLSLLINKELGKSFFELINDYRIDKVKQLLISEKGKSLSLEAIAFDSGFNSTSSFYKMFKKRTGITPKEFQKSIS